MGYIKFVFFIMRIKILAFLLIIISFSCGRESNYKTTNSDSILEIDLLSEPESKITRLSEIAENVEYIPMQTTDSSLIGDLVRKIVNIDDRIYILNSGLESEILCFNTDGKFYYKINKSGRGPEEYLSLTDFDINYDNKLLTILSALDSRIKVYRISESGFTFQRSVSLSDPRPYRIAVVPETDNIFLAIPPGNGGTAPTLSILINTYGDTLHLKPNCYKIDVIASTHFLSTSDVLVYSIGNTVCFKELFSDTVFYVDSKDNFFKPRMVLNTHGTLSTPEMRSGLQETEKNTTFIYNIFETTNHVFYLYKKAQETKINRILFDKKTKTKYKLDVKTISATIANIPRDEEKTVLKDDLSGGPDFNIEFSYNYCNGVKLFSFVDTKTLKNYVAGEEFKNSRVKNPEKKQELEKLADSLKETDNPVLVMLTAKE